MCSDIDYISINNIAYESIVILHQIPQDCPTHPICTAHDKAVIDLHRLTDRQGAGNIESGVQQPIGDAIFDQNSPHSKRDDRPPASHPDAILNDVACIADLCTGIELYRRARASRAVEETSVNQPVQVSYRSEEHTSELQSPTNLVCRLLLEKK